MPELNSRASSTSGRRGLSLVGLLAAVLLVELLLERWGVRLVHDDIVLPRGPLRDGLDLAAFFVYHVASVLAVLLAALACMKLVMQPAILVPQRGLPGALGSFVVGITMLLFVVVAALGVTMRLQDRLLLYLVAVFTYLVVVLVGAALRHLGLPGRGKLWLTVLVCAVLAHAAWQFAWEIQQHEPSLLSQRLLLLGEALVIMLASTAPLALWAAETPRVGPLVAGGLVSLGFVGLTVWNRDLAARLVAYGFGVQLPASWVGVGLCVVAAGALTAAIAGLLVVPGLSRLRGWGLLLLALAGYQLSRSYQLASALVGLVCVLDSYARLAASAVATLAQWRELLRRTATNLGATQVVAVGPEGSEAAQIAGTHDGEAVELKLERRGGRLVWGELVVGHAPAGEPPPLSVSRRGSARLGPREGIEVATGDKSFDDVVVVRDGRRLIGPDPVLDDELRPRLAAEVDGWLGVWPGRGARFRTASVTFPGLIHDEDASQARLVGLVNLLVTIKRRG